VTSSKRQKASRTKTLRATEPASAALPAAPAAAMASAVIPLPTGRRLMLAKRQSEAPTAAPHAPTPGPSIPSAPALRSTRAPTAPTLPTTRTAPTAPTIEERRQLVAKLAYFRAERLGFRTDPVEDWLWAEREVERMLSAQSAA